MPVAESLPAEAALIEKALGAANTRAAATPTAQAARLLPEGREQALALSAHQSYRREAPTPLPPIKRQSFQRALIPSVLFPNGRPTEGKPV